MAARLVVNEIYLSLQGESTFAGLPCVFVRLTACPLRCSYCDTAYAFTQGRRRTLVEVLDEVRRLAATFPAAPAEGGHRLPLVEMTGGEPLAQPAARPLKAALADEGFTVLLETSGALDITAVDPRVRRIVDVKCPASGEAARNHWANLAGLRPTDEVKFVIGTREDYAFAREMIARHGLPGRCPLLFSWVHPLAPEQQHAGLKPVPAGQTPMARQELAEAIVADALPVRFQVQLHKDAWPAERRAV